MVTTSNKKRVPDYIVKCRKTNACLVSFADRAILISMDSREGERFCDERAAHHAAYVLKQLYDSFDWHPVPVTAPVTGGRLGISN